jgi:poly-gamma-glutamate synthesis protein (capsule biosynthesis protein)
MAQLFNVSNAQNENNTDSIESKNISILFLGDIMQHDLQINSAYNHSTNSYDFSSQFKYLKPLFDSTDVIIGNLEVTLGGPPYKGYPRFSSPDDLAVNIKNAGINYLATANNHVYDKNKKGFERTLNILDSLEIKRTGAFLDESDKVKNHPMIINENGFKIALFNYTYGLNGNVVISPNIVNMIKKESIADDLRKAKLKNYDAIIIFFHWGIEYERRPNKDQISLAELCLKNGADIIIGSHPHVIQKMEYRPYLTESNEEKDVLIAYSLGNYVSNYGTRRFSDGGVMIRFVLQKNNSQKLKILNPSYIPIWVYREPKDDNLFNYYVLPVNDKPNCNFLTKNDLDQMNLFITDTKELLESENMNVPELKNETETNP